MLWRSFQDEVFTQGYWWREENKDGYFPMCEEQTAIPSSKLTFLL
jgi:hypothetical protein